MLLDFITEYSEAISKYPHWIGNERLAEMEQAFDRELKKIIDQRIKENQNETHTNITPKDFGYIMIAVAFAIVFGSLLIVLLDILQPL